MRDQLNDVAESISRRRLLTIAGAATAVAAIGPSALAARQDDGATPVAATPVAPTLPEFPIPSTLAADASALFRTVCDALVASMKTSLVPGVAIGLLAGGREEHATFGLASLSSMLPVMPDTLFQIGSISKTVTATAIWRLIDEGALELDATVRTYLPGFTLMDEDVAERVTISHLLDHSGGWYGDEGFDTGENDDALERYVAERMPQLPQVFPLGEFSSYNNAGFTVLGRLIEVVTGTTYRAAIHNLLINPLGLLDTLLDHDAILERPYADGHAALVVNGRVSVAVQTPLWIPRSVDPAGGIWSTTQDLVHYARFHMDRTAVAGDTNIVQPASLAQMQEPANAFPGLPLEMGKDWFVQDVDGIRANYHGGDTLGQHADLIMIPEHDFAIAVLTNGQGGGAAVAAAALNAALAGISEMASLTGKIGLNAVFAAPADLPVIDLPEADLDEYAGRFADPGQALTFTRTDAGLEVTLATLDQPGAWTAALNPAPAPTLPVTFIDKDLADMAGTRLPFVRDADGHVAWVSLGLRLIPRVDEGA